MRPLKGKYNQRWYEAVCKGNRNRPSDYRKKISETLKRKYASGEIAHPTKGKGVHPCLNCGRDVWHSWNKFCSFKCYNEYRKGKPRPEVRGKPAWNKGKLFYKAGEEHWHWKGGIGQKGKVKFTNLLKELIRERDGYKCQLCGVPQQECVTKLDVHHIDNDGKNYSLNNLISLCHSCHSKLSYGKWKNYIDYFRKIVADNNVRVKQEVKKWL